MELNKENAGGHHYVNVSCYEGDTFKVRSHKDSFQFHKISF